MFSPPLKGFLGSLHPKCLLKGTDSGVLREVWAKHTVRAAWRWAEPRITEPVAAATPPPPPPWCRDPRFVCESSPRGQVPGAGQGSLRTLSLAPCLLSPCVAAGAPGALSAWQQPRASLQYRHAPDPCFCPSLLLSRFSAGQSLDEPPTPPFIAWQHSPLQPHHPRVKAASQGWQHQACWVQSPRLGCPSCSPQTRLCQLAPMGHVSSPGTSHPQVFRSLHLQSST